MKATVMRYGNLSELYRNFILTRQATDLVWVSLLNTGFFADAQNDVVESVVQRERLSN
jgi:hypothetical protein